MSKELEAYNEFLDIIEMPVKNYLLISNNKLTLERYRVLRTQIETALKDYESIDKVINEIFSEGGKVITTLDIKRKLKALEIIKEKPWLVNEIVESKGNYDVYKSWCKMFRADMKYRATKEEYVLLKEVLL